MRYLVQCVSGMQEVVARQLLQEGFRALKFRLREEGLLVFEAAVPPGGLRALRYINNCFLVVKTLRARPHLDIEARLTQLLRDRDWSEAARTKVKEQERTFRLMLSDENRLVAGDKRLRHHLALAVAQAAGLRLSPRGADAEFWVIRRRSGWAFLAKRITTRVQTERDLEKGELRPELAYLLCLMSEPDEADVFLDAFSGSGAIPRARTAWPYKLIFALDRDDAKVRAIRRATARYAGSRSRKGSRLIARVADARHLTMIGDGSIDKVVSDPPWGFFDQSEDFSYPFYRDVVRELVRVTKPGGIIILLLGDESLAERLVERFTPSLKCQSKPNILLSGRKAVVLKWMRA